MAKPRLLEKISGSLILLRLINLEWVNQKLKSPLFSAPFEGPNPLVFLVHKGKGIEIYFQPRYGYSSHLIVLLPARESSSPAKQKKQNMCGLVL